MPVARSSEIKRRFISNIFLDSIHVTLLYQPSSENFFNFLSHFMTTGGPVFHFDSQVTTFVLSDTMVTTLFPFFLDQCIPCSAAYSSLCAIRLFNTVVFSVFYPPPYRSCILSDFGNIWCTTVFRPNRSESEVLFTRATPYPP